MSTLHITQTLMIADFQLEYSDNQKLLSSSNVAVWIKDRAISRMKVIKESIEELEKQMKDPERHNKLIEGGYEKEELNRFKSYPQTIGKGTHD